MNQQPTVRSGHSAPWVNSSLMNGGPTPPVAGSARSPSYVRRAFDSIAEKIDRRFGWHRLAVPAGLAVLAGIRNQLRLKNLYDTSTLPATNTPVPEGDERRSASGRSPDGSYNDLAHPSMGMAGARFNRNFPLDRTYRETEARVLAPNPRVVSRRLMTRHEFIPAGTLNSLAAAWVQFMIRDWFSHDRRLAENPWKLDLEPGDDWPTPPLTVPRIPPDKTRPATGSGGPPTFVNINSAWWDGSSIYGNNRQQQQDVRTGAGGKLHVTDDGDLPQPEIRGQADASQEPGFWLGLLMMTTLFKREHNAICDQLQAQYPDWADDHLFEVARLVNSALLAKIHTVEWTPAILSHPTTVRALRINWWGLASERVHRLLGRISSSEIISGIPGSATNHFGVPFNFTEEFVAVYRMHPLIRDHWPMRAAADDTSLGEYTLREISGPSAVDVARKVPAHDLLYSFGTLPPGAITLNNFPHFLQQFERPDGQLVDLAATDILRTRETGVPRYNEFRRLLRMNSIPDFESLTDDPVLAATLSDVYQGDIDQVDLVVGMFAEKRPDGFAFSDTAFRIFILMASRRLNSDRFLTEDYTPQIYTPVGLNWIESNGMVSVLLRHHPQLRPALRHVDNAFKPWRTDHI